MPNFTAFISYVFVITFTPGPNNIMSMANGNKYGYRKTIKFLLGIVSGFFIIILLSNYFNLLLFNLMPKIKFIMGIIGAIYMTYLAFIIIKSKDSRKKDDRGKLNSFFTGMVLQLVNPKAILYSITVTSNFIIPYYKSSTTLILFSLLLAFIGFISISCWALFGEFFQKFLANYRKPFNIAMGLLLIYSAISISGILELFS